MSDHSCPKRYSVKTDIDSESHPCLPFFPAARPDETLGSRCSRFHRERGNEGTRKTFRDIFGSSPFQISNLYIPRIERLAARLPGDVNENVRRLTHQSTAIPLVALFSGGASFDTKAEFTRRSIGETGVTQICVDCMREDIEDYGSPHLHRSHQFAVVGACWRHGRKLIDRCPNCSCPIELPRDLVLSPWAGCPCGLRFEQWEQQGGHKAPAKEIALAKFIHVVLNGLPQNFIALGLPSLLRDRAYARGFRWGDDKIDRGGLLAAMETHYTSKFLAAADSAYRQGKTRGWLNFLGQSDVALEGPLSRNLLLVNYLFEEGEAFLTAVNSSTVKGAAASLFLGQAAQAEDIAMPDIQEDKLGGQIDRLATMAVEKGLIFDQLWQKHSGAMKKIVSLGGKVAIEKLRSAIEAYPKLPKNRRVVVAMAHPKDQEWAEAIKATASRFYEDSGKPVRVTMAALIKGTEISPGHWPDAGSFPAARAACEAAAESQCHFYARRVMWSMSRYYGKNVARTVITEDSGLEHHRANDILHYLLERNVVPVSPFVDQLKAKGIQRDWDGPCPEKVYRKVGRGYVRTGKRTAYSPPGVAGEVASGSSPERSA